jgi:hypothetical protein
MQSRVPPAWHALCLLALAAVYTLLVARVVYSGPYDYDEADYMFASHSGLWDQANDIPTMSLAEFVRIGRSAGSSRRADLSETIRASNDVFFYRHWHGPIIAYWLLALKPFHLDEIATRRAGFAIPLVTALVVYLGACAIYPGWLGLASGFLASALYLWSYAVIRTNEVTPHQMFAAFSIAALLLAARMILSGRRVYWYLAIVASVLAFCAVEVAFVLVFALACAAWMERRTLRADWAFVWKSVALFVGATAVIWPAALYKLSLVKTYAFLAYQAVYRKSLWGEFTLAEVWRNRIFGFPAEWAAIAAAVVIFAVNPKLPARRALYPFLIFSALMLLVMLRVNTTLPRYLLPFEPTLLVFTGFVLAGALWPVRRWLRAAGIAVLAGALFANTIWQNRLHPVVPDPRWWNVLAFIRDHGLERAPVLVPAGDLPTVHYYFPYLRLRSYSGDAPAPTDFAGRQFAAVLFPGSPVRFER